jgi:early secretory antigenic target protein ESAT-6
MAPNDMIVVDYVALAQAEAALAASQKQIAQVLQGLNDDLAPLLATWEGDGRDAYLFQQNKWNGESASLNSTLASIHVAVRTANTGYQQTDQRIANAWQAVR